MSPNGINIVRFCLGDAPPPSSWKRIGKMATAWCTKFSLFNKVDVYFRVQFSIAMIHNALFSRVFVLFFGFGLFCASQEHRVRVRRVNAGDGRHREQGERGDLVRGAHHAEGRQQRDPCEFKFWKSMLCLPMDGHGTAVWAPGCTAVGLPIGERCCLLLERAR